jgi:hypothetical protein
VSLRRKNCGLQIIEGWAALSASSNIFSWKCLLCQAFGGFVVLFAGVGLRFIRKIKAFQARHVGFCL